MIDFYDYLNAEDESKEGFTKAFKDEITARVFTRLEDIKKDMASEILKSDENESS